MGYISEMYRHYQANKARLIAEIAHKGQKRKGTGEDYINHPRRVVERLIDIGIKNKLFHATAWLHDVIEDTEVTIEDLKKKDISMDVIRALELLTKKKQSYRKYLSELKKNEIARAVKIEDMLDNLSDRPSRDQILKYCEGLKYLLKD